MEFKCYTKVQYFTASAKKKLEEFLSLGVETGVEYENSKGEKRIVRKIAYPQGLIKEDTVYYPGVGADGGRYFHTPLATLIDTDVAKIDYQVGDEWGSCDSNEWIKWVGSNSKQKDVPDKKGPELDYDSMLASKKAQSDASRTKEEFEKESKEWTAKKNKKK